MREESDGLNDWFDLVKKFFCSAGVDLKRGIPTSGCFGSEEG